MPIGFPLIEIVPLEDYRLFYAALNHLETTDWAIFISSNAVQNGMPRALAHFKQTTLNERLPQLQFAAIGPVTASELMQYGVLKVLTPEGRYDSESLLRLPEMQAMRGKQVMIFRGIGGRDVLAESLKVRGATVRFAECYQRINPQHSCAELQSLWANKQCHAMVVTSSEAMRHLLKMTHNGSDEWLRQIHLCVNHPRIAEEVGAENLKISIANGSGDDAMLACLQKTLTQSQART